MGQTDNGLHSDVVDLVSDSGVSRKRLNKNAKFWDMVGDKLPEERVMMEREHLFEAAIEQAQLEHDIVKKHLLDAVENLRTASHIVYQHKRRAFDAAQAGKQ